jgi:hypothetical protein
MITIKQFPPEIEISTTGSDSGSCLLLEPSQRQLLAWFAREKPEMMREAMGVDMVLKDLEHQRMKAEQEYRSATDTNERQYKKARNNTLYSVIKYLEDAL